MTFLLSCSRCHRRGQRALRPVRNEHTGKIQRYVCTDRIACSKRAARLSLNRALASHPDTTEDHAA